MTRAFTEGRWSRRDSCSTGSTRCGTNAAYQSARARSDNAKRTLQRLEPLLAEHAVAQQDVDNARSELEGRRRRSTTQEGSRRRRRARRDQRPRRPRPSSSSARGSPAPPTCSRRSTCWTRSTSCSTVLAAAAGAGSRIPRPARCIQPGSRASGAGDPARRHGAAADGARSISWRRRSTRRTRHAGVPREVRQPATQLLRRDSSCGCGSMASPAPSALAVPQRAVQQGLGRQFVYVVGRATRSSRATCSRARGAATSGSSTRGSQPATAWSWTATQKVGARRAWCRPVAASARTPRRRPPRRRRARRRAARRQATEPRSATSSFAARSSAAVISIVITLLGALRDPAAADRALSADHAAGDADHGDLSGRHGRRRGRRRWRRRSSSSSSGLQGLLYYSSANSSDGSMNLTIYFDVSRNQDLAAVDVQNAVKLAEPQLPDAVRQNGITIVKANTDILARRRRCTSSDPRYDAHVPHQLHEALRRGRDQARSRRRQRDAVPGARLLDAAPARSRQDGAARHHRERRRSRGARAERHQPRRPAGRASRRRRARSSPCRSPRWAGCRRPSSSTTSSCARGPTARSCGSRDIGQAMLGAQSYDLAGRLNGSAHGVHAALPRAPAPTRWR